MLKPQMLEAIFVAGCVLAGMTGPVLVQVPERVSRHMCAGSINSTLTMMRVFDSVERATPDLLRCVSLHLITK